MIVVLLRIAAFIVGLLIGLWAGPWFFVIYAVFVVAAFKAPWEIVIIGVFLDFIRYTDGRFVVFGLIFTIITTLLIFIAGAVRAHLRASA